MKGIQTFFITASFSYNHHYFKPQCCGDKFFRISVCSKNKDVIKNILKEDFKLFLKQAILYKRKKDSNAFDYKQTTTTLK
nr:uncharacterized protein LOC107443636 [Parasteatoda tepidariorum]